VTATPIPVVRVIVPDADRRVLILRRAPGTAGAGTWCLPGGKIDYGDTVEQTAIRELAEETGLRATTVRFLFYQDILPIGSSAHCVNLCLECRAEGTLTLNHESTESAWIAPGDLTRFEIGAGGHEALNRYWCL
jgi:8-oxo-dGTP pyrophosphatase MutT (NUDIX family)